MRKCWMSAALVLLCLNSCLLDSFYAKKDDDTPSTAETVQKVVRQLPYGEIVASVIGIGSLIWGGKKIHKHVTKKKHSPPAAPAA